MDDLSPEDIEVDVLNSRELSSPTSNGSSISDEAITTTVVGTDPVYRELNELKLIPRWLQVLHRVCPQPIRNAIKPPSNKSEWKKFLFIHLPIVQWVIYYSPKFFFGDMIAGLTIGVTHVPQGNKLLLIINIFSRKCYGPCIITLIL